MFGRNSEELRYHSREHGKEGFTLVRALHGDALFVKWATLGGVLC